MNHPRHPTKKISVILLLMTMTLLGVFPLDVVLPSFPALSDYFRTSSSDIALSVSVFAIGLALSVVLIGPLSDLLGRKKLLLGGITVAVVGATGCLFSSEYRWFLGFRMIQRINANTQIIAGLCLIFFSGLVMLYLLNQFGVSTLTVLIPMIICTAGTTITRPAATSKAMDLFPDNTGTSASAGNTLIFIFGGLISALINMTASNLELTLAICFLLLSVAGLVLNAFTYRRNSALAAD